MKIIRQGDKIDGLFDCMKRPVLVRAKQMNEPFQVESREGLVAGKPGDYLMCGIEGEYYVCAQEIFEKSYDFIS